MGDGVVLANAGRPRASGDGAAGDVLAQACFVAWPEWRLDCAAPSGGTGRDNIPCVAAQCDLLRAASRWMAGEAALYPGLDARGQAAFTMGSLSFALASHLAAAALVVCRIPALDAASTHVLAERYVWTHGEESGEAQRFRILAPAATAWAPASPATIAGIMAALMEPCAAALREVSRLGLPALRRLVADGLASGFLHVGQSLEREAEAMAIARAALDQPGLPFANPDTGFQHVTVPADDDAPDLARWFLRRGGCCRWFTLRGPDGPNEKCGTCVHLTPEEQQARLGCHLVAEARAARNVPAAEAAA
jgi:hypothetical protein